MGGTSLKLVFITIYFLDKTISLINFLLTNNNPSLTLAIICSAESTRSFSTRTI